MIIFVVMGWRKRRTVDVEGGEDKIEEDSGEEGGDVDDSDMEAIKEVGKDNDDGNADDDGEMKAI